MSQGLSHHLPFHIVSLDFDSNVPDANPNFFCLALNELQRLKARVDAQRLWWFFLLVACWITALVVVVDLTAFHALGVEVIILNRLKDRQKEVQRLPDKDGQENWEVVRGGCSWWCCVHR